jgi:hypothetical protein
LRNPGVLGRNAIEANSSITASKAKFIDHVIMETIEDFPATAPNDNITVEVIDLYGKKKYENKKL